MMKIPVHTLFDSAYWVTVLPFHFFRDFSWTVKVFSYWFLEVFLWLRALNFRQIHHHRGWGCSCTWDDWNSLFLSYFDWGMSDCLVFIIRFTTPCPAWRASLTVSTLIMLSCLNSRFLNFYRCPKLWSRKILVLKFL